MTHTHAKAQGHRLVGWKDRVETVGRTEAIPLYSITVFLFTVSSFCVSLAVREDPGLNPTAGKCVYYKLQQPVLR